jgi:hypothetical protein
MTKSLGEIIDAHITANMRIFMLERDLRDGKEDAKCPGCGNPRFTLAEIGQRAIDIRTLNKTRTDCINAINEALKQAAGVEYHPNLKVEHASR